MRPSLSSSAKAAQWVVHDPRVMTNELIEQNYQMASLPLAKKSFLRALRATGNIFGHHKKVYGPNVRGLASIKNPALIIWGRKDRVLPVKHAHVAAKGLPDAQMEIFENCGIFQCWRIPIGSMNCC